ncbi:MAG: NusA-like transcription termination signal-binding factor [Nanoarchaeota archaeon]
MKIKYDASLMKFMALFEQITRVGAKDCFVDEHATWFIVPETDIGKAIGKGGQHVRLLERKLNRKIKIVAFSPQSTQFISNLIYPLQAKEIREEEGHITIVGSDTASKGVLIGRNGRNLRNLTEITKRFFPTVTIEVM